LWICTDQQRYDTIHGLNNPHIHTPNLDHLCAEGVAFARAYCQCPVCTPSRASFLTGLYPSTVHQNRNGNAYFTTNERVKLITRRLTDTGYDCALVGKLHIASSWGGREHRCDDGYRRIWFYDEYRRWLARQGLAPADVFASRPPSPYGERKSGGCRPDIDIKLHRTTWCADRAIEFMEEQRNGPWLMSVNINDPHPPYAAPTSYADRYNPAALPRPLFRESDLQVQARLDGAYFQTQAKRPPESWQDDIAHYYGMIELMDEQVGRMLEALERTGQRENTLVVFTSDHGEMLGDHGLQHKGCRFYEGAVHVPLIMSWPGHFRAGLVSNALVELMDIAPTLADVAGIPLQWTQGKSLLPILTDRAPPEVHRPYVRCEYYDALNMLAPYEPEKHVPCWATMYRDDRFKLVVYHGLSYGELYDTVEDPHEFDNLWEASAYADIKMDLLKSSFDASIVIADPGPPLVGRY